MNNMIMKFILSIKVFVLILIDEYKNKVSIALYLIKHRIGSYHSIFQSKFHGIGC